MAAKGSGSPDAGATNEELTETSARQLMGLSLNDPLDVDGLRRQFHRCALQCHPDKTRGAPGSEADFNRLTEAYQLLIVQASDNAFGGCTVPMRSVKACDNAMMDVLRRALLGEDVTSELEALGVQQPPPNFGMAPFPPFERPRSEALKPVSQSRYISSGSPQNNSSKGGKETGDKRRTSRKVKAAFREILGQEGLLSESDDAEDDESGEAFVTC